MAYDIPMGIAALAGGSNAFNNGGPVGFGGGMASVLGATQHVGDRAAGQADEQFRQILQMKQFEQQVLQAEEAKRQQMLAQRQQQRQQQLQQQYVQSQPEQLQALAQFAPELVAKQQAQAAFRKPDEGTSLQQNLIAAGLRPGTPEFQQAMMQAVNKPAVQINQPSLPAGFMPVDPQDLTKGVRPIPGSAQDPNTPTTQQRNTAIKAKQTFDSLNTQLDKYGALLDRVGSEVVPGKDRDELMNRQTQLLLDLKELNNLGVLNGPDEQILRRLLIDPTTPTNLLRDAFSFLTGGDTVGERARANVEVLREQAADKVRSQQPQQPLAPPQTAATKSSHSQRAKSMGLSMEDVEYTAKQRGLSVQQVLDMLERPYAK